MVPHLRGTQGLNPQVGHTTAQKAEFMLTNCVCFIVLGEPEKRMLVFGAQWVIKELEQRQEQRFRKKGAGESQDRTKRQEDNYCIER